MFAQSLNTVNAARFGDVISKVYRKKKQKTVADVVTDCTEEILIDSVSCVLDLDFFFFTCAGAVVFVAILHVEAAMSLVLNQFEQEMKLALIAPHRPSL